MRKKTSAKESDPMLKEYGRPVVYNREIVIDICARWIDGEDFNKICHPAGMPLACVFRGWIENHKEAREIYRSARDLKEDRRLARDLDVVPRLIDGRDWADETRAKLDRGWPADWNERKFIPPDWSKVYVLVGQPPVWSVEERQAYDQVINHFTMRIEPRDFMELALTKQAADAHWEGIREAAEKTRVAQQSYQRQMEAKAQPAPDEAVVSVTKPANAGGHRRGLPDDFAYYQGLDIAQSRKHKRIAAAFRQIERLRDSLGAQPRRLPDEFLDQEALAQHYGVDEFLARTENDAIANEVAQATPAFPSDGRANDGASPRAAPVNAQKGKAKTSHAARATMRKVHPRTLPQMRARRVRRLLRPRERLRKVHPRARTQMKFQKAARPVPPRAKLRKL
jgi:hypothetical protein